MEIDSNEASPGNISSLVTFVLRLDWVLGRKRLYRVHSQSGKMRFTGEGAFLVLNEFSRGTLSMSHTPFRAM